MALIVFQYHFRKNIFDVRIGGFGARCLVAAILCSVQRGTLTLYSCFFNTKDHKDTIEIP